MWWSVFFFQPLFFFFLFSPLFFSCYSSFSHSWILTFFVQNVLICLVFVLRFLSPWSHVPCLSPTTRTVRTAHKSLVFLVYLLLPEWSEQLLRASCSLSVSYCQNGKNSLQGSRVPCLSSTARMVRTAPKGLLFLVCLLLPEWPEQLLRVSCSLSVSFCKNSQNSS